MNNVVQGLELLSVGCPSPEDHDGWEKEGQLPNDDRGTKELLFDMLPEPVFHGR